MKLRLSEYDTFPVRTRLEADPESFGMDFEGVRGVREVSVELNIQMAGDEYFCQAGVRAVLVLECVRCLGQFESELSTQVDFIVCPEAVFEELRKEADDAEEYVFCEGMDQLADVSSVIKQAITLAVPMMPRCAKGCQGLCPQCGVNRNLHDCDCSLEQIDNRWEGLKDLQEKKTCQ